MFPLPVTKKAFVLSILLSLSIVILLALFSYFDNRTKIVFCDVGQGDGAYLRIFNKIDVLIDAGPDNKMLHCLGKYLPFYDRTVELVIISHPDKDHIGGIIPIIDRYNIKTIVLPPFKTDSLTFIKLIKKIKQDQIKTVYGQKEITFHIFQTILTILSPKNNFACSGANKCSLIALYQEGKNKVLFTGDADIKELLSLPAKPVSDLTILKIPHHGSKQGLSRSFFKLADPTVSVISVGKNNPFGHPTKEVLDILKASKTKIRRTDEEGDIVYKLSN